MLLAGVAGCGSEPADKPYLGLEATLKAAEQRDADAQNKLGDMYGVGNKDEVGVRYETSEG